MQVVLALSLLAVPGLMGLALLMEWLELRFAGRYAEDDIRRALEDDVPAERVEALVAQVVEPVLRARTD